MRQFANDLLSTLVFVGLFLLLDDVRIATLAAMAAGAAQIVYFKATGRPVDAMLWMSLALVVVFGSVTLHLDDPRFIMVKPSIIHFAIAAVMLRRGWIGRYLPPIAKENLPERMVTAWGYGWAALMVTLGIANIAVALLASPKVWAFFAGVVLVGAKLAMFALQYVIFRQRVVRSLRESGTLSSRETG